MRSEFKLLRIESGKTHFAHVTIEASPAIEKIEIVDRIQEPINQDNGEVSREHFPAWIDAALRGALNCSREMVRLGHIMGCRVVVQRVVGSIVDTNEEDIACASSLATWQALGLPLVPPRYYFRDGNWNIQYATQPGAAPDAGRDGPRR